LGGGARERQKKTRIQKKGRGKLSLSAAAAHAHKEGQNLEKIFWISSLFVLSRYSYIPYNNSLRAQTLSLSLSLSLFYKKNESVLPNERERARHGEW